MLQHPKALSTHLSKFLSRHFSLQFQQLRPKSSYEYGKHKDKDGAVYEERARKRKENQEGHLQLYKSRGQHLLTNPRILDSIVSSSNIKSTDTVLEIGPGTGNLTVKLLEVANKVVAVEIDKRMVEILRGRVAECGLEDKLTVSFNWCLCAAR